MTTIAHQCQVKSEQSDRAADAINKGQVSLARTLPYNVVRRYSRDTPSKKPEHRPSRPFGGRLGTTGFIDIDAAKQTLECTPASAGIALLR